MKSNRSDSETMAGGRDSSGINDNNEPDSNSEDGNTDSGTRNADQGGNDAGSNSRNAGDDGSDSGDEDKRNCKPEKPSTDEENTNENVDDVDEKFQTWSPVLDLSPDSNTNQPMSQTEMEWNEMPNSDQDPLEDNPPQPLKRKVVITEPPKESSAEASEAELMSSLQLKPQNKHGYPSTWTEPQADPGEPILDASTKENQTALAVAQPWDVNKGPSGLCPGSEDSHQRYIVLEDDPIPNLLHSSDDKEDPTDGPCPIDLSKNP